MSSGTVRRRLHGDVGGKKNEIYDTSRLDGLDEPLLGNHDYDDKQSEVGMQYDTNFSFNQESKTKIKKLNLRHRKQEDSLRKDRVFVEFEDHPFATTILG